MQPPVRLQLAKRLPPSEGGTTPSAGASGPPPASVEPDDEPEEEPDEDPEEEPEDEPEEEPEVELVDEPESFDEPASKASPPPSDGPAHAPSAERAATSAASANNHRVTKGTSVRTGPIAESVPSESCPEPGDVWRTVKQCRALAGTPGEASKHPPVTPEGSV